MGGFFRLLTAAIAVLKVLKIQPINCATDSRIFYTTNIKSADWIAFRLSPESLGIASSLSREAVRDD